MLERPGIILTRICYVNWREFRQQPLIVRQRCSEMGALLHDTKRLSNDVDGFHVSGKASAHPLVYMCLYKVTEVHLCLYVWETHLTGT